MPATGDEGGETLTDSDSLVATGDVLDSSVEDERVILDRESDVYYGLNRVGAHLWEEVQDPRTVGELVESTATEFDVSTEECRDDVFEFLDDMLEAGLVERV